MKNYWHQKRIEAKIGKINQWLEDTNIIGKTINKKYFNIFCEFHKVAPEIAKYIDDQGWSDMKSNIMIVHNSNELNAKIKFVSSQRDTLQDWLDYVPIGQQLDEWYNDINELIIQNGIVQEVLPQEFWDENPSLTTELELMRKHKSPWYYHHMAPYMIRGRTIINNHIVKHGRQILRFISLNSPCDIGKHLWIWNSTHYVMMAGIKEKYGEISMNVWQESVERLRTEFANEPFTIG